MVKLICLVCIYCFYININMSFFRSEQIDHYKLLIPKENAWNIMNTLGQKNMVHIVPHQSNLIVTRPFQQQSKRCNDALQKVRVLEDSLIQKIGYHPLEDYQKEQFQGLYDHWQLNRKQNGSNHAVLFQKHYDQIIEISNKYNGLQGNSEKYKQKVLQFREHLAIVRASEKRFGSNFYEEQNRKMELSENGNSFQINYKAGVVNKSEELSLRKTALRITKGNSVTTFVNFEDIFIELNDDEKQKSVFFILFPGTQGSSTDTKLDKLITSYSSVPKNILELKKTKQFHTKLQNNLIQSQAVWSLTDKQMNSFLHQLANQKTYVPSALLLNEQEERVIQKHSLNKLQFLKLYFLKQQEIYHQLNQFHPYHNFLSVDIFVKSEDAQEVRQTLAKVQNGYPPSQLFQPNKISVRPTKFSLNDYTAPSYQIVSTYGTPRYKQANPAFFTTVTFPFLFGVMFGDIGHGMVVLGFGLYLIFKQSSDNEFLKMILPYRYLIGLMGFFATYCGFIYNDYLSISLNLFGSCFDVEKAQPNEVIQRVSNECIYPFGMDPAWRLAQNNLNYVNSLKMKISVIIAVVHMTLGVFIKASNAIYYRKWIDFFFQFLPQVIFMVLLFGYMDFLIVYKWLRPWQLYDSSAPSIITTMINLPLKLGKTQNCCGAQPMWGQVQQTTQDQIQLIFLLISVLCIPLMLFPKPIFQIVCNRPDHEDQDEMRNNEEIVEKQKPVEHQQQASEIFVHQLIQTIEYVLGCISNTASYLRLWALSLAHSQLSEVFFNKTIEEGIISNLTGIPQMFIGFFLFAGITFGVLLCMDSMECFLHTLRLHWVEFQNKFYKGDGVAWSQFSLYKSVKMNLGKRDKHS